MTHITDFMHQTAAPDSTDFGYRAPARAEDGYDFVPVGQTVNFETDEFLEHAYQWRRLEGYPSSIGYRNRDVAQDFFHPIRRPRMRATT